MTADELLTQADTLRADGRYDESHARLLRAVAIDPDHLYAMAALRDSLLRRRHYDAALVYARRLVTAAPNDGVQWHQLASVLMSMDRLAEANSAVDRALQLAPESPVHWHQAAILAHRMNDSTEALRLAGEALSLDPYGKSLKHDRAHMLLAAGGDLVTAFEEYEVRWETQLHLRPWDIHVPEWKGEPLAGKRILLHSEQGLGDAIMLARLARDLVELNSALVGLALPRELTRLFATQGWPQVQVVDLATVEGDGWDYQTPMFSAFRHLSGWDHLNPAPYITVVPPIVIPPMPEGFRVGVCWSSGRWNLDTGLRRIAPLEALLPLAEIPGVRLISLQKGDGTADIPRLGAEALLCDPMPACDDFAATAAVVAKLDAVVTVDTAMLHLAAAMGVPTFMLVQYTRCWRWWELPSGRPWYGCITAAKCESPGDWSVPIEAAKGWVRTRCR